MAEVLLINDNFMYKWINLSNQKHRLAELVLKNDPTISYILQTHFRSKNTNSLKSEKMKEGIP